nr:transposase [Tanacetum cinerariifolium]
EYLTTIVDEAIAYIKTLEETLQELEKQKLEKLHASSSTTQLDTTSHPQIAPFCFTRLSPPPIIRTWSSPNISLDVCGVDGYISICSSKKSQLFTRICFVLENLMLLTERKRKVVRNKQDHKTIWNLGLYNIYYTKYGNSTTTTESSSWASSSRASGGNQMTQLLNRLKEHKNKKARSDPSLSSEYERYVHLDFVTHLQTKEFAAFDVLSFWKAKETMFPVLSRMAMDILSIQATSVASEYAFSTSERVLSIRRTRLTPVSLEMCMRFKDHLDVQERKQDKSTLETPVDFEEQILDAEVQENKAIPLSDEKIALDAASSEGSMSGPDSR